MHFLDITCKSIIGDNECAEIRSLLMLMFIRTVDIFACVYCSIPSAFLGAFTYFLFMRWAVLLEPFLLTCSAFVYCLKKKNISEIYYS